MTNQKFGTTIALCVFRKWFAQGCESIRGRNRDEAVPGLFTLVDSLGRNYRNVVFKTGWPVNRLASLFYLAVSKMNMCMKIKHVNSSKSEPYQNIF